MNMDSRTLEALKGSIQKWEKIVAGTGEDEGWRNCPLCLLFNSDKILEDDAVCQGCPVREKTGQKWCHGSPYSAWLRNAEHSPAHWRGRIALSANSVALAQAELDFLKSLLPEGAS